MGRPLALLLWLAAAPAAAQDHLAAVLGEPGWMVAETDLACDAESVMVVGVHAPLPGASGITGVRWAHRARAESGEWSDALAEGSLPETFDPASPFATGFALQFLTDPTVAADGAGGFVCTALAMVRETGAGDPSVWGLIVLSRWSGSAGWSLLRAVEARLIPKVGGNERGFPLDKPVLVAGEPGELYLTWWYRENVPDHPKGIGYRRSTDGGATWVGEVARDAEAGDAPVQTWFAPEPSAAPGTPLYVAYTHTSAPLEHRFVMGVDRPDGTVRFVHVRDADGAKLALCLAKGSPFLPLPGKGRVLTKAVPQIAVDPLGVREFYVAWHDEPEGDGDVDVFVAGVSWESDHWEWTPAVRLDTAGTPGALADHADQFLPAIAVDPHGDVHVTLYDDRRFVQGDDDADARYDLVLARSRDRGATFRARRLPLPPGEAAWWDLPLTDPWYAGPLEYNGLAWSASPEGELEVWASASGTSSADPGDASVLWTMLLR